MRRLRLSTEQHKAATRELFGRFTASDIPGVLALMTDDATWWIASVREYLDTQHAHAVWIVAD